MRLETVTIHGRSNDLAGLRYLPEGDEKPISVVLAHGFTSGKYSLDSLASYLATRGYEALTFDFVGHKLGCSGGVMETMAQAPRNVADALSYLRGMTTAAGIVLIGHSMGAAAALAAAAWELAELSTPALIGKEEARDKRHPPIAGVVSICMGTDPSSGFGSSIGKAMLEQRRDYVAGAPALDLIGEIDTLAGAAAQLGDLPALFVAARQDVLVSVERVERLAKLSPTGSVRVIESSHLEAPDRSRATIFSWLSELSARFEEEVSDS